MATGHPYDGFARMLPITGYVTIANGKHVRRPSVYGGTENERVNVRLQQYRLYLFQIRNGLLNRQDCRIDLASCQQVQP